jgi:hypothetical protein
VCIIPFDDQTRPRIWLEILSLALILQLVEAGDVTLVNSSVLEFENTHNPLIIRRDWMTKCLQQAKVYQLVDLSIRARAEFLEKNG